MRIFKHNFIKKLEQQKGKELKSFLGLSNYFRDYVKDYGSITAPLNDLLRKSTKYEWKDNHKSAFNSIKLALTSAPVLAFPEYSLPFEVPTDASMIGIGDMLLQPWRNHYMKEEHQSPTSKPSSKEPSFYLVYYSVIFL